MHVPKTSTDSTLVSRPGRAVKQADVDLAADTIFARGERPTVERVRGLLGRGSPNTLGPLIDNWHIALSARVAGMQSATGHEKALVPTEAINAFNLFWDTALSEARTVSLSELASERAQLAEARATTSADHRLPQPPRIESDRAAHVSAAIGEQAAQLQDQLMRARQTIQDLQGQLVRSEAQRQREVEREVERAASNDARMLAEVSRARGEAQEAQEEARRVQGRLDALTAAIAERDTQLARFSGALGRAEAVEAELRAVVAIGETRLAELQRALVGERALVEELRRQMGSSGAT